MNKRVYFEWKPDPSFMNRVGSDLTQSSCKYDIDTHKDDPKLPGVFVFCGSRESGKTYACVQMCKHFEDQGYIHFQNISDLTHL